MTKSTIALAVATIALLFLTSSPTCVVQGAALPSGDIIAVTSTDQYCLMLPSKPGQTISDSESSAVSFCNKPVSNAPNARSFPTGFIKSVHFVQNTSKGYVQITGRFDRSKYSLPASDGGGQYDTKAPVGASCEGYSSFVELVEPDEEIYCLRCCKNKTDCPVNKSTYGCKAILGGGDYS
ncbi:hypothetical protein BG004_002217 [Podila humilis]|nr:hypothetical protein BG004_002217 [Podila humilis]